jgi:hypothetical protein
MQIRNAILIVVLGGVACAAQDVSLGDYARQQRAKNARQKTQHVVTNDDLPHASPEEAMNGTIVGLKPPEAKAEDKATTAKPGEAPAGAADTDKRLAEIKATEEAQQRAVKKYEEELKDDSIGAERRGEFEEGLKNAKEQLAQTVQERQKIEAAGAVPATATPAAENKAEGGATAPVPENKSSDSNKETTKAGSNPS